MKVLLLNLMLMTMWVVSTGSFTYANSALGFIVAYGVLWWLRPLLGPTVYFRKLPMILRFIPLFLWEVVKSNVRVAWDVVTPNRWRQPGIVAVPLDATTDIEITVLVNLITLTPGTLCVNLTADRRTLFVHSMFVNDPEEVRREIKQRLEYWVLALLQ
jgi:multicomponent Na+:H+ antiporter subunit E